MKFYLRLTLPQCLGLLMLASVLLWGQIVNAQHVHLDNHAPHECVSCQQLNGTDAVSSHSYHFAIKQTLRAPLTRFTINVVSAAPKSFSIRAPPTI